MAGPTAITIYWPSFGWLAFFSLLLCFLIFGVYWDLELLDHYVFRQTQTASVARDIANGGPWLAYLLRNLGPPWTAPMEFPTYQLLVAGITNVTGADLEHVGRLVSAAFGIASLFLIVRILALMGARPVSQFLAAGLFATSPLYIYWSLSFMIETMALCLSLAAVALAFEYLFAGRKWALFVAPVVAILAALTKITTLFPAACVVGLAYAAHFLLGQSGERFSQAEYLRRFGKLVGYGLVLFAPALIATIIWVDYSDAIKANSPFSSFLTSDRLTGHNFGALSDRWGVLERLVTPFQIAMVRNAYSMLSQVLGVLWPAILTLCVLGFIKSDRHNRILSAIFLLAFLAGPLVFSKLYFVHYYYWVANAAYLIAFVAVLLPPTFENFTSKVHHTKLALGMTLAIAFGSAPVLYNSFLQTSWKAPRAPILEGKRLQEVTASDEITIIFGYGWNPAIQYHANRSVIQVRRWYLFPINTTEPKKTVPRWFDTLNYVERTGVRPAALLFCRNERNLAPEALKHPYLARYSFKKYDGPRKDVLCELWISSSRMKSTG